MKRIIRNPIKWLKRLRTKRGFGVHSPFAFDFITKVLCDKDAYYYAYPEVDSLCGKSKRKALVDNKLFQSTDFERQEARMLFRIIVKFQPEQIVEIGGMNEVTRVIIERASPHSQLYRWSRENPSPIDPDRSCLILVNNAIEVNFTKIRRYILRTIEEHHTGVVIFSHNLHLPLIRKMFKQVEMVLTFGQTFYDEYTAVYVGYRRLPRQAYLLTL